MKKYLALISFVFITCAISYSQVCGAFSYPMDSSQFVIEKTLTNDSLVVKDEYHFTSIEDSLFQVRYQETYIVENAFSSEELMRYMPFSSWKGTSFEERVLDSENNDSINTTYMWNNLSNSWLEDTKTIVDFDENNDEILREYYTFSITDEVWVGSSKFVKEDSVSTLYLWDENTKDWSFNSRSINYTDSLVDYIWDTNLNNWRNKTKSIACSDSVVEYNWDTVSDDWFVVKRDLYNFDLVNKVNVRIRESYNLETGIEEDGSLDSVYYNSSDLDTLYVFFIKDTLNDTWKPYDRRSYKYDADDLLSVEYWYDWDSANQEWVKDGKTEHFYDESGFDTLFVSYQWDTLADHWIQGGGYCYWGIVRLRYDEDSNNIYRETHKYDWKLMELKCPSIQESAYSATGKQILAIFEYNCMFWGKDTLEFNQDDLLTRQTYYTKEDSVSDWIESTKTEYIYNQDKSLSVEVYYEWNETNTEWDLQKKIFYYYDTAPELPTEIKNSINQEIIVFPNPAREIVNINWPYSEASYMSIISINGSVLSKTKIYEGSNSISVQDLSSGIYFISIQGQNANHYQKLIIE